MQQLLKKAKELADEKGIKTYLSNRSPNKLFIGEPAKLSGSKRAGYDVDTGFTADIVRLTSDVAIKKALDAYIKEKGLTPPETYTVDFLSDSLKRVELKKLLKELPAMARTEEEEEENQNLLEFITMFKKPDGSSYDHPADYIVDQFKDGVNICPIARLFVRKQYVTPNELITILKSNRHNDIVEQLKTCPEFADKSISESAIVSEFEDEMSEFGSMKIVKIEGNQHEVEFGSIYAHYTDNGNDLDVSLSVSNSEVNKVRRAIQSKFSVKVNVEKQEGDLYKLYFKF